MYRLVLVLAWAMVLAACDKKNDPAAGFLSPITQILSGKKANAFDTVPDYELTVEYTKDSRTYHFQCHQENLPCDGFSPKEIHILFALTTAGEQQFQEQQALEAHAQAKPIESIADPLTLVDFADDSFDIKQVFPNGLPAERELVALWYPPALGTGAFALKIVNPVDAPRPQTETVGPSFAATWLKEPDTASCTFSVEAVEMAATCDKGLIEQTRLNIGNGSTTYLNRVARDDQTFEASLMEDEGNASLMNRFVATRDFIKSDFARIQSSNARYEVLHARSPEAKPVVNYAITFNCTLLAENGAKFNVNRQNVALPFVDGQFHAANICRLQDVMRTCKAIINNPPDFPSISALSVAQGTHGYTNLRRHYLIYVDWLKAHGISVPEGC